MQITKADIDAKARKVANRLEKRHKAAMDKLKAKQGKEMADVRIDAEYALLTDAAKRLIRAAGINVAGNILDPGLSVFLRPQFAGQDLTMAVWDFQFHYTGNLKPSQSSGHFQSYVADPVDTDTEQAQVEEGMKKLESELKFAGLIFERTRTKGKDFDNILTVKIGELLP